MAAVRVVPARGYSLDTIREVLGVQPLPLPPIEAPSLLVDGRYHQSACRWLQRKHSMRPVESTTLAHAARLGHWIAWLRNDRHLVGPDWITSDVFVAREDDLLAYYRQRQYSPDLQVSSATWRAQLSTIKQFHQWLTTTYGVPAPFTTKTFTLPNGTSVTGVDGMRPRRRPSSAGTPLTPGFAELLIQGALRIDVNGQQHDVRTAERDGAFISLGLGTGMRLSTLAGLTHYEVPQPEPRSAFTAVTIPDFITKGDAGGEAIAFSHRLRPVHHYMAGDRADMSSRAAPHRPADPIHLLAADGHTWTCEIDGKTIVRRWAETDASTRWRLVDTNGRSPLLWLDPRGGTPIGYDTCERITSRAAQWTNQHIHTKFPPRIHTHDLRHTYATHLTVCIFKRALTDAVTAESQSAYAPTRLADAVEMAKMSLGHASDQSTELYTRHAHKMLDIPLDDFLGRF